MKVTESVYEILAMFSSQFLPQLLCIDFICIDQDNNEEKEQQVPMMGKIYSHALFTTVFLVSRRYIIRRGETYCRTSSTASAHKTTRLASISRMPASHSTSSTNCTFSNNSSETWGKTSTNSRSPSHPMLLNPANGQHSSLSSNIPGSPASGLCKKSPSHPSSKYAMATKSSTGRSLPPR
jgi:hypothetical protein